MFFRKDKYPYLRKLIDERINFLTTLSKAPDHPDSAEIVECLKKWETAKHKLGKLFQRRKIRRIIAPMLDATWTHEDNTKWQMADKAHSIEDEIINVKNEIDDKELVNLFEFRHSFTRVHDEIDEWMRMANYAYDEIGLAMKDNIGYIRHGRLDSGSNSQSKSSNSRDQQNNIAQGGSSDDFPTMLGLGMMWMGGD